MVAVAGGPSFAGNVLSNLFFARQPEPDLEFTEEELEQTTNTRSSSPMKSPKKSGGRPLLWVLLLALIGGGAYVAMEPEMAMDWVNQLLGETPAPQMATRPAPMAPPAPASPDAPASAPADPQASAPMPAAPAAPIPGTPAPAAMPSDSAMAPPPASASLSPLFGESQRVTVAADPALAGGMITLSQDSAGTRPGPAVRPGTGLTILDGDLQPNGWVYSVRSDDGVKGWVAEKRLRLKP
ncbi:MAG: SH3 domain-containing protein [Nitrospira sp.]|nr:SH3 domain-containing protein [Nitrospira sp.]